MGLGPSVDDLVHITKQGNIKNIEDYVKKWPDSIHSKNKVFWLE